MKRKKKKRRFFGRRRDRADSGLQDELERAAQLAQQGRFDEVIDLLTPWAEKEPRNAQLYVFLGLAYMERGAPFMAITFLEKAAAIEQEPALLGMLGSLYALTGNHVLALPLYEKARSLDRESVPEDILTEMRGWEEDIKTIGERRGIPYDEAKKGLTAFHRGRLLLAMGRLEESISFAQEALRHLGEDYPPALNNLASAYFLTGAWRQAIETSYRVLETAPDNIFALSNLVRFLAWTGQEEAAKAMWERLKPLAPETDEGRLKKAEAAAVMEEDEAVYDLLSPVMDTLDLSLELMDRATFFLAVASANSGKRSEAMGWFRELRAAIPRAHAFLDMVKQGRPGPGLMDRYPYFSPAEMTPLQPLETLSQLIDEKMSSNRPEDVQAQILAITDQFPGIYVALKQTLEEFEAPDEVLFMLEGLGTPEAHAILKEFALGRKGSKEDRLYALQILVEAGVFPPGTTIQFWDDEGVKSLEVRETILDPAHFQQYDIVVFDLLEEGYKALEEGRHDDAREAFQRALEHNPQVKEAYNNLATFAMQEGRVHEAKALLNKALEIDPDYLFARTNLAQIFLEEGRIDKAEVVLEPVAHRSDYHPSEVAALASAQARILIEKAEYVRAEALLQRALEAYPEHILAQRELDRLERMYFSDWSLEEKAQLRKMWKKDALRYRKRQQKKLTNPHPTVAEALGVYTKDQLKAMGWHIAPEGGWSQLRKQELLDLLVARMKQPETLERLLDSLTPYERKAFSDALAQGGVMDWDAFNDAYGNDFIDSPYWEYHEPQTPMGRLRIRGLIVEALDGDRLVISIPVELREMAGS